MNLHNVTNGNIIIISHQERILAIADKIIYLKDGVVEQYAEGEKVMAGLELRHGGSCSYAHGAKGELQWMI